MRLAILLLGLSLPAHAAPVSQEFKIEGKIVRFAWFRKNAVTISADCVQGDGLKSCDARRAMEKASLASLGEDPLGGNPGASLCSQSLGGTVVWSRDRKGNERTFCRFGDGSMIGTGTLSHYGRVHSASHE